jgi:hypothetical protein
MLPLVLPSGVWELRQFWGNCPQNWSDFLKGPRYPKGWATLLWRTPRASRHVAPTRVVTDTATQTAVCYCRSLHVCYVSTPLLDSPHRTSRRTWGTASRRTWTCCVCRPHKRRCSASSRSKHPSPRSQTLQHSDTLQWTTRSHTGWFRRKGQCVGRWRYWSLRESELHMNRRLILNRSAYWHVNANCGSIKWSACWHVNTVGLPLGPHTDMSTVFVRLQTQINNVQ